MKILILGHMRHGKDTVADIICSKSKLTSISSSVVACNGFIYDILKHKYNYKSIDECFNDRFNHRPEWHQLICDYNKNDKARLAKDILKEHDIYVGMRDIDEITKCIQDKLFDYIIGVYDPRKQVEPEKSFNFNLFDVCDVVICNNSDLINLNRKVDIILNGIL